MKTNTRHHHYRGLEKLRRHADDRASGGRFLHATGYESERPSTRTAADKGDSEFTECRFSFPLSNSPALSFGCQLQRVRRRLSHWEGKSGVFQRYSQVKLQTKREALAQLNRRGIEITPGVAHLTDVRMGFGTALVRC